MAHACPRAHAELSEYPCQVTVFSSAPVAGSNRATSAVLPSGRTGAPFGIMRRMSHVPQRAGEEPAGPLISRPLLPASVGTGRTRIAVRGIECGCGAAKLRGRTIHRTDHEVVHGDVVICRRSASRRGTRSERRLTQPSEYDQRATHHMIPGKPKRE